MPSSGGDVSSLFDDAARPSPFGVVPPLGAPPLGAPPQVAPPHVAPLGLVCPLGLLPLDRPLHLQNHKARQVGLRKTSFCPLVVNACVTYWNGHDKKDSTLPETLLLEFASSTNLSSCFDPSVLKGISATSASAAPAGTQDSDSQAA